MGLRQGITRKTALAAFVILVPGLALLIGLLSRRPPRVPMERFVPATALALVEVDSLVDLFDGLTGTMAWRELAPQLGLSSQLDDIGWVADWMGRTGFGPDEAVVAGRAQVAFAITGLDAESGATDEGPYIKFKPRVALLIATHTDAETAAKLVRDRSSSVAQRIYGNAGNREQQQYFGSGLFIYPGPTSERKLVVAAAGSVIIAGNHEEAVKSCLDTINGRAPSLADDSTLNEFRSAVDRNASVFAFITAHGSEKLAKIGPILFASRFTTNPERLDGLANLFGHLAKQTVRGFMYGAELTEDGVTDRYLTVLSPAVGPEIAASLESTTATLDSINDSINDSIKLVPAEVEDFTVVSVSKVEQLPDRLLKRVSPRLDLVGGLALREFVLSLRREFGIESADSAAVIFGNELTFLRFGSDEPITMLVPINDERRAMEVVGRYLRRGGMAVSTVNYGGIDFVVSANPDGRAAALIDNQLVLGTRKQIEQITDARDGRLVSDDRIKRLLSQRPGGATVTSYRASARDAATVMLAISELLRATDGSPEILDRPDLRTVIERLPPSISFTEFRDYGIYTETRSAVGNFDAAQFLVPDKERD